MSTKAEIIASIDAAKSELEQVLVQLQEMPALDWNTVRCAAHTLGNYLNATSACVQLLEMDLADHPNPEVHGWLQTLERSTHLMTYIARQLTNASATSEVPLLPEKVDLARMAQRAASFYESVCTHKNLTVLCEANGPVYVRGDRIALAAVFDNLLANASKYSPAGKRIDIQVKAESGHALCTVQDQGPGISAEDQAQLFQKGVRLSATPTGGETSTGFGLFITKRLIERMGGSLWCESTPGQGCKFCFRLRAFEDDGPCEDAPGVQEAIASAHAS